MIPSCEFQYLSEGAGQKMAVRGRLGYLKSLQLREDAGMDRIVRLETIK
jgi:hypothetical protein